MDSLCGLENSDVGNVEWLDTWHGYKCFNGVEEMVNSYSSYRPDYYEQR